MRPKLPVQLFPYHGSKAKIIDYYPKPKFDSIIELFAGSASYSLRHGRKRQVILFEPHPNVFSALQYLINESTEDKILNLPLIQKTSLPKIRQKLGLSDGEHNLLSFWVGNGHPNPGQQILKDGKQNQWNEANRYLLSQLIKRIKHWKIYNHSYEHVKQLTLESDSTYFIDPPRSGGDTRPYLEDKRFDVDYTVLKDMVHNWHPTSEFIVCENDQNTKWIPFNYLMKTDASLIFDGTNKGSPDKEREFEMFYHK